MRWRPRSVRVRLALAYAMTFALLLLVYAGGVYAWVRDEKLEELEGERDEPEADEAASEEQAARRELDELLLVLLLAIPPGALCAGACGFVLARRALAPVDRIVAHAGRITADRLAERLPVANPDDELGRLAATCNDMIARLETSFAELKRFTADASHELRTPLTALRSVGEVGLREARSAEGYREVIGSMLEEIDRLAQLVDALLTLARADAGHLRPELEACDLAVLVRDAGEELAILAEEKQQPLDFQVTGPLPVRADAVLLRRAIGNVLDNAIKHGPRGAPIRIVARPAGREQIVEVIDQGPGIAPEHHARIFERFHRIDPARTREAGGGGDRGGTGLGLALAHATVVAHGGRIEVESRPGKGATFRIVLPA